MELLANKNQVKVFGYSEKGIFISAERENEYLKIIYSKKLCVPKSSKITFQNETLKGYFASKAKLNQIKEIINFTDDDSIEDEIEQIKEQIKSPLLIPKLTSIKTDLLKLDSDQKKPVILLLTEINEVLAGTRETKDITWQAILAGPGSGKTYTLIVKMLIEIILPSMIPYHQNLKVLATTFTRAGIKAIKEKFNNSDYPELIEFVDINTISSIGYQTLKEKYPLWKFDLDPNQLSFNDVVNNDFSKSSNSTYQKNQNKTETVMKYLNIDTYYKYGLFHIQEKDYMRYKEIYQRSLGFLIEDQSDIDEFLRDENITDSRDIKLLNIFLKNGDKEFKKFYKKVNNFIYKHFYSNAVSLAKNYNIAYDDYDLLFTRLNEHKSSFNIFLKKNEFTLELIENVLRILKTSDIFHTIDFQSLFDEKKTYRTYLFDYDDFARIPLLENLIPSNRYDFFFIDEFQDLNIVQYEYLIKLAELWESVVFGVGDIDQAVFYYGATQHGLALKLFSERSNVKTFELTYNYRCPKAVCESYVLNSGINKKYTLPENAIDGINKSISYEESLSIIESDWAITCPTNAMIFDTVISLIELNKKVSMGIEEFDSNMYPIYDAIRGGKTTTKELVNYYRTEIRNRENAIKAEHENDFEEVLNNDYTYKNLMNFQKKIMVLLKKFNYIDSNENVKQEDIYTFINKIKEYIVFDDTISAIKVLTYLGCKGLEFNNMLIVNMESLNDEWKNQSFNEILANKKIALVISSRAKIGNYYTNIPKEISEKETKQKQQIITIEELPLSDFLKYL